MRALVLVDLQYDFLPGGALAVARGDETIAIALRLMREHETVLATQDWHPRDHKSFAANNPGTTVGEVITLDGIPQVMWPAHCVRGTRGGGRRRRQGAGLALQRRLSANAGTR